MYQQDKVTFSISLLTIVALLVATIFFFIDGMNQAEQPLTVMTSGFNANATIVTARNQTALTVQLEKQAPHLPTLALQAGLQAYQYAEQHHQVKQPYLAIADMAQPSSEKRLWVFDMRAHKLVQHDLVAHGKTSGVLYAKHFSNEQNSDATSIGVYETSQSFVGNDGLSLRLKGLEPGFNANAYQRDIVFHGASYVSKAFVKQYHRLGRSWGCPAVSLSKIKSLVHLLHNGALLMIYYPQKAWLQHSKFLHKA